MSVFEDLIDELKNENLLEDTVIELRPEAPESLNGTVTATGGDAEPPATEHTTEESDLAEIPEGVDLPKIEKPSNEREFFRKRAMDEVSSLQMVEHVLSGVEREHMKISPVSYDDLGAKKALHKFIQVSGDLRSPEHAEAEFELRQETEAWNYALYERDQKISVANIRRFCEESRPVLSSQALIAMARFYRNSPYSEDVRGKFDYIMTRLFSREAGDECRRHLFKHDEMIGHINTLYANWSSIALYTNEDDQVEVSLTVTRFDEFIVELENAENFGELLQTDFFGRVRSYKEESAEMFYVPEVVAAAIACNLAIGNRYVELIAREKVRVAPESIEEKYAETDGVISEAAGKSLSVVEVLALEFTPEEPEYFEEEAEVAPKPVSSKPVSAKTRGAQIAEPRTFDLFGVNKWLMAFCIFLLLVSGSIYMFADRVVGGVDSGNVQVAQGLEIDDPEIKQFVSSPRMTKETFYAVVEPSFKALDEEQQRELLARMQKFATAKNLKKVNLLDKTGRTVAFASQGRLELIHK